MHKKASAQVRVLERTLELLMPVLVFVMVLYVVWSSAHDRTAYSYFQSTELANIIDAATTLDGQVRIKYALVQDDFNISLNPALVQTSLPKTKTPIGKKVHIPNGFYVEDQLPKLGTQQIKQVQIMSTNGYGTDRSLAVGGWTSKDLKLAIFNKDQRLCPEDPSDVSFRFKHVASTPKDVAATNTLKIYIDDTGFDYPSKERDSKLQAKVKATVVDSAQAADIIIRISSKPASFAAFLITQTADKTAERFACALSNAATSNDLVDPQYTMTPVLVPSSISTPPGAEKPTISIDVSYDPQHDARFAYVNTLANAIDKALVKVTQ